MSQQPPEDHLLPGADDGSRRLLSDDRGSLGQQFEHAPSSDAALQHNFVEHNRGQVETLGDSFADPGLAERHRLGESFADPNSLDDTKLGESFAETNSSHRRRHKPERPHRTGGSHRTFYLVSGVVLLVLLAIFLFGFLPRHERNRRNEQRASDEQTAKPVVDAVRVRRPSAGTPLVVPGTTTPLVEAYLYARANGYLAKRLVDIGDRVHRGQLLAVIDSPDLDQQVDQAREQVRQAEQQLAQQQAQLALNRVTNDRYQVLVRKGVFSRQDGDQQATNYNSAMANVAAAQRNVDAFQSNLRRMIALQSYERVTAPFDGIVTQRNVDVGALISAQGNGQGSPSPTAAPTGGTTTGAAANTSGASGSGPTASTPQNSGNNGGPLFAIAQVERLRILVSVPEGYAGSIRRGTSATLHFQEFPTAAFTGTVTRTADSIDQNTRTMLTEVQVPNRDGRLLNGMYAVASFPPSSEGAAPITISGDAIAVRNGRNVVALIHDGTVHVQPVEVGRDFGPAIEILSGLKVGDLIASSFTDEVRDGAKVDARLQQPPGTESGNPPPTAQRQPPGGTSQYGDQSIPNENMQGVSGQSRKKQGGNQTPSASKGASKQ